MNLQCEPQFRGFQPSAAPVSRHQTCAWCQPLGQRPNGGGQEEQPLSALQPRARRVISWPACAKAVWGGARGSPPRGTVHRLWSGNRAADVLRVAKGPRRTIACRCSQSASNSYAKPSRINSLAVSGSAARAPSAKHSAALSRSSSSIPKLASVASAKVNRTNYLAFYASIYAQERGSRMRKRLDEAFTPRVPPGLPPLPRSLGDRSGVEA